MIARGRTDSRPLWRTAWRRVRRRPLQTFLLLLGVALGVAMMVSIDLANGSASRAFALSTDAVTGQTTHRITGGPHGLDEAVYRQLVTELGFAPAAPVVEGYLLAPELGDQPMRLMGVDPFAEAPFRDYLARGTAGPSPELLTAFLTQPDAIVLSAALAERFGLGLGDAVRLDRAGHVRPMRIVGLLAPADDLSQRALDSLILADIATAQETLAMAGRLSHIDLIVADEAELRALQARLPAGVRVESAAAASNAVRQMAAAFELNLTALSLLALVVGMFLIYNTVTFSVVQRRPTFGILRSLGATPGQLFRLILAEAAVVGLLGSLLGLVGGILLGRFMVSLVSQTINDFYFVVNVRDVSLPAVSLLRGLLIGLGAAMLAALAPAWEAMGASPQSDLRRSALESRARRVALWLLPAFAALVGLGALLLALPGLGLVFAFAGLFAVLVGCALATPAATVLLMRLVGPLTRRLAGVSGRLAPRDIVRSLSRTSVAIAALMVAVAVIVGVSILIGSFRLTVANWLENTLRADVYVSPPTLTANRVAGWLAPEVVEAAAAWPGVAAAVTVRLSDVLAPEFGRPVEINAVDGDVSRGRRRYAWVDGNPNTLWPRLAAGRGVMISEPLVIREGLALPPGPVRLHTPAGPQEFPVIAVFYDFSSDRGSVIMDADLYQRWWGPTPVTTIGLFLEPGQSADVVSGALRAHFAGRGDVVVQSIQAVRANALEIFDRTFAITAALRLLAIVVAFIGVLSALMSLQLERGRELGVLRAVGMTVAQLWRLVLLETGLMGAMAGLLALPVGWLLAWILVYVINRRSFGWTLALDARPEHFAQALAIAVLAALLAGLYPALHAGRTVIATAVREE
ncbi:MAG: FtsX-like permease family protein [Candidatus Promineifilaceae bacterium]